eukprot:gene956-553_t
MFSENIFIHLSSNQREEIETCRLSFGFEKKAFHDCGFSFLMKQTTTTNKQTNKKRNNQPNISADLTYETLLLPCPVDWQDQATNRERSSSVPRNNKHLHTSPLWVLCIDAVHRLCQMTSTYCTAPYLASTYSFFHLCLSVSLLLDLPTPPFFICLLLHLSSFPRTSHMSSEYPERRPYTNGTPRTGYSGKPKTRTPNPPARPSLSSTRSQDVPVTDPTLMLDGARTSTQVMKKAKLEDPFEHRDNEYHNCQQSALNAELRHYDPQPLPAGCEGDGFTTADAIKAYGEAYKCTEDLSVPIEKLIEDFHLTHLEVFDRIAKPEESMKNEMDAEGKPVGPIVPAPPLWCCMSGSIITPLSTPERELSKMERPLLKMEERVVAAKGRKELAIENLNPRMLFATSTPR